MNYVDLKIQRIYKYNNSGCSLFLLILITYKLEVGHSQLIHSVKLTQ